MKQKHEVIRKIFSAVLALAIVIGFMPQMAAPAYAADPVYDITFHHNSIYYGEGDAGHLKGSSTDWEHPTWGNDTWVGSGEFRPKVYYEAGNDHFTLKVNISRVNGSFQPGGNYVSGTVKYNGHTITFENWGPFDCGFDWVDIRFERTAITFNYNGGRNHTQGTSNISADYYWYNSNDFSIVDTYDGKNFDIENQPWWKAYPPVSSNTIFDGWWTDPTGGTKITTEDITKHKGTQTLYAHWEPYHLVQLVGGTNVTPSRGRIDAYGHHDTEVVRGSAMEPVVFTANEGYHIDHNSIDDVMERREGTDVYTQNGVTVERISDTQYVAFGTPTGQVHIWIPNGHKYENWTTTTAATCTTAGEKERVCKYDNTIKETATIPIDSNAHSYKFNDFTWTGSDAGGYTAAKANYVCEHDASHTKSVDATISDEVTDPTCTEPGKTTYTATVEATDSIDGEKHTASKDAKPTGAKNHKWKFTEITWTGNDTEGYTAAKANYVCEHDASHTKSVDATIGEPVVTNPTCTEPGKTTYTATVEATDSIDGEKHTASKDAKPTGAKNHKWKFTEITWIGNDTDGYTAPTAHYVCENNPGHTTTADADRYELVTDPTCTEPGKTIYTATVKAIDSPDGQSHGDRKEIKFEEPLGHDWKFTGFTWTGNETDGYTGAVANYECERKEHDEDVSRTTTAPATISEDVLDPTCTDPGKTTYTATVAAADSPDGQKQTESKIGKPTEATDHKWKFEGFTWTGNETDGYTAAVANYVCENDSSHTRTVNANISNKVTDPTCTEAGKTTYTATVAAEASPDGQKQEESKDAKVTKEKGHKYGSWTKLDDKQHQRVCEHDKAHVEKANHSWDKGKVTKKATEKATGVKTYTCTVCKATKTEAIPKIKPTPVKSTVKPVLVAKAIANGKTAGTISGNKVKDADRYVIYFSSCNYKGKTYKLKKVKTVNAKTFKWKKTKLNKNRSYKFYVVAQKKSGKTYKNIVRSKLGHFYTGNVMGKYTNAKSLELSKTALTIKKGKSASIKATVAKVKKNKKFSTNHAALLRYTSNNPTVATVNAKGKITAKKAGTATIYVQTINGIWKTCKVTVK